VERAGELGEATMKETLFVSFSGGRTSGYMCHWLIENKSDEYDMIFVFANTGLEHEKTLEFVDRCDKEWGLGVVWVEAVVNPEKGKGVTHKVVTFEAASRKGEPMEDVIKKYGIPNQDYPHCTRETKLSPMFDYKRSLGFKSNHQMAIGIRSDEPNRLSKTADENGLVYPLAQWTQCTLAEIRHWWADQEFDLDLPTHYGNCVTCWKKSDRKLLTIAKHDPHYFDFMDRMEQQYPRAGHTGESYKDRVFFRRYRTALDFIMECKEPFNEFIDTMPEYQLDLLPIDDKIAVLINMDEMDEEEDCGSGGCEIT
jgi:3'-phosphoadenosine 5'-phosphosulfate sulfotransferase (PAPS reductase)/FAD synthetase